MAFVQIAYYMSKCLIQNPKCKWEQGRGPCALQLSTRSGPVHWARAAPKNCYTQGHVGINSVRILGFFKMG